jgi:hypothetical protein
MTRDLVAAAVERAALREERAEEVRHVLDEGLELEQAINRSDGSERQHNLAELKESWSWAVRVAAVSTSEVIDLPDEDLTALIGAVGRWAMVLAQFGQLPSEMAR